MQEYLTGLAAWLQLLFTAKAEQLGRATRFIQRQRQLTAGACAQTLVFRRMADGKATLESMAEELEISPQALHQHLGAQAQAWLHALLVEALRRALRAPREALGLLDRFTAALVEDTTAIALPAELAAQFPGCGGGSGAGEGAAAVKVRLRWDVRDGALHELSVHAGRTPDQDLAAQAADVPEGGLHLADQGFFNTERRRGFSPRQFWISRVPARTRVCVQGAWQALAALLAGVAGNEWDGPVGLVEKADLPCRLVARRCPAEVAGRRRQKLRQYTRDKKGREPSAAQLQLCDWVVFATNVPAEHLSARGVWVVYRCRWQVELLFKRAKSLAGWGFSWGRRGARLLVELYAKLLGLVVLHWGALLRGGPLNGSSAWKRLRVVQAFAQRVQDSLCQGDEAVRAVLAKLQRRLGRIRPQAKSRKKPSTRQLLLHPDLVP
jgi:hypothetical protein